MKDNHLFSRVPRAEIPRSSFNRSHSYTTTMDSGKLVPIFVDEVLPGDTFNLNCNIFSRITTMVVPVLDNIYFDTHFFFVPNRLVWKNFQKFMGEQDNPGDSISYLIPTITAPTGGFAVGSLADYFGIPVGISGLVVNALPFRAYNLIYNEWFRDENLINSVIKNTGDGPDSPTDYSLLKRGKRHDYFTSALPWPQKGPGVEIPLGASAPVFSGSDRASWSVFPKDGSGHGYPVQYYNTITGSTSLTAGRVLRTDDNGLLGGYPSSTSNTVSLTPANLYADLSQASSATINTLRTAFQLQRFYEACARGGTRYTEILRSHFGVVSPDARLQRPEYLGGMSSLMQVNSVMQTSATTAGQTPQGNLSAYGVLGSKTHGFTKSFVEHGYIIGLLSIRTDLRYQQGLNKMWSRKTREDFYWPTFAHLGEQAVLNKEIYAQGPSVVDTDGNVVDELAFGYQERYAEYRYYPSLITGKMRSGVSGSLDVWHLAQQFTSLPTLNQTFIEENVPMSRVLAVTSEPEFKVDCYFNMKCVRPMPVYGTPGFMDHF